MKVIDAYCGAGGLSCGLMRAGLEVVLGVDVWREALKVYRRNLGVPTLRCYLSTVPELPPVDALVGSPPCTDFSSAGKREEGRAAALTPAFARILARHRPKLFALENLEPAAVTDSYILACCILHDAGYGLSEAILDARYYGVPQTRRRLVLAGRLGGRDDELRDLLLAGRSNRPTTVREHCGDCLAVEYFYQTQRNAGAGQRCIWSVDEVAPTVRTHVPPLPAHYRPVPRDATRNLSQVRSLSVREAAMIQTFPLEWDWSGVPLKEARTMVGNAVPPRLAEHLGRVLLEVSKCQSVNRRNRVRL